MPYTDDTTVRLQPDQYRYLVAVRYLNASDALFAGLRDQKGKNDFHFLTTLRSFIEYTRRGIWFLVWATDEQLQEAGKLTFEKPGSPGVLAMDEMISEALGNGRSSALSAPIKDINNERFIDCLHALTHGNPIAVRMLGFGLDRIFQTDGLLLRAEADLNLFRILLYRRMLGTEVSAIWKLLQPIHNEIEPLRANAKIAGQLLKDAGLPFPS